MTDPEPVALNEFNDLFRMLQRNTVYQQIMALEAADDCLCMGNFSCTNRTTPLDQTKVSLADRIEMTRQQIRDLQHQLEEAEQELASDRRAERATRLTALCVVPIFWSDRPADWQRTFPSLDWLGDPSPSSAAPYPVVLDALDAADRRHPTALLRATALAIAPRWDELAHSCHAAEPQRDDAPENIDQSEGRVVVHAAARAIAELGYGYGLALVLPAEAEGLLHTFVTRLARFAEETGFTVACVGKPAVLARNDFLNRHTTSMEAVPTRPTFVPAGLDPQSTEALNCLAASQIGAPLDAVVALGLPDDTASSLAAPGPGGQPWLRLSARTRRRLWGQLDEADRRRSAKALFGAWAPDGWGYLRRAHLQQLGRDVSGSLQQHGALLAGYRIVGQPSLQQHCAALALTCTSARNGDGLARERAISAHISAARLAAYLRPAKTARAAAVFHFGCARRLAIAPRDTSQLTADLANAYAVQRHPRFLAHARHLYEQGLDSLADVHDDIERLRIHIAMLNGLALVDYHEGKNEAALRLETRAEQLAGQLATAAPTLGRWAYALLGVNTAKLLSGRFDDRTGARQKLETALGLTAADHHGELIRRALGQIYFDEGEFSRVIDVLAPIYPPASSAIEAADDEFHDRLLLAVAQLTQNKPDLCAAQLPRLQTLARRMGTEAWITAVELVRDEMSREYAVMPGVGNQQQTRQGV